MMNAKRLFLILFSVSFIFFHQKSLAQEANPEAKFLIPCTTFHDGTFEYANGDRQGIKFVRKGKKQVEKNEVNGEITTFKVKWTEDCVCERTFKKSNIPTRYSQLAKGGRIVVTMDTILVTSEDFYEYKEMRFGVKNYPAVRKILTKKEVAKRKNDLEKKIREDSLIIVKAARVLSDSLEQDSLNKAKGLANAEKEKKAREDAAAKKKAEENKSAEKSGTASPSKEEKTEKTEKSEKKEKAPKEKSEKKEKEEKPKKEKKEKEDKPEKKEKPEKNKED